MNAMMQNRYLILAASVLLQFCYGIAYVWSVFQPYVKEMFSMDTGSANLPFGILLALFSVGNIVAGYLQKHYRPMYLVIAGNAVLVIGLVLSAIVPADKGYLLNVTYGAMAGFGGGFAYNTNVATVQKWFPDKRGLVTGILICATGSFGLIMNPVAKTALNAHGYSGGMLMVAGIMGGCTLIGSWFIRKPAEEEFSKYSANTDDLESVQYSISDVLRTPQYYMITGTMMLAVPAYFLVNPMLMSLGTQRGLTENSALAGVMLVAVMNTCGRLLAPWVSDKTGRKKMILALFALNMIAVLGVSFLRHYGFMLCVTVVGFTYGGFMGMYPTITVDYFGSKHNGINYGAVMLGYGISSLACPYLVKAVQASSMGLPLSFIIAAGASIVGFLLVLPLKKPIAKKAKPAISAL